MDGKDGGDLGGIIPWPGVTKLQTKRDRIPPAQRDWLARCCRRQGAAYLADRLFPRLAPLAGGQALGALLAAEANGDGYLVGRNPWTGRLEQLPSPTDHVIVEPQRFRLYWFVSEHPVDLAGDWRSLTGWSMRWQVWGDVALGIGVVSGGERLPSRSQRPGRPCPVRPDHWLPVACWSPWSPWSPWSASVRRPGVAGEDRPHPATSSTDEWAPGGAR